jgi:hypothetical protein
VLNNGRSVYVQADQAVLDPMENALVFRFGAGTEAKFYWPNVAYYVPVERV